MQTHRATYDLESQQIVLDNQEEVLKELRGLLSSTDDDGTIVVFTPYTVQKGDHLADICSDFGLDYQANIRIIKAINGIADVNMIYVGQTIILPIHPVTSGAVWQRRFFYSSYKRTLND